MAADKAGAGGGGDGRRREPPGASGRGAASTTGAVIREATTPDAATGGMAAGGVGAGGDAAPELGDPLAGDPRVAAFLGDAYAAVSAFHTLLTEQGVLRGLIGPREVGRLWERHLLNSAAVVPFLPATGVLVDVGSGAGLPGVVLAAMLPGVEVVLLEPMERRVEWLEEVAATLALANVVVRRARAEEVHGHVTADAVTARAVAPMDRLARWTMPLLRPGGVLVALKGRRAADEVQAARHVFRQLGAGPAEVLRASTLPGLETTTVVRLVKQSSGRP